MTVTVSRSQRIHAPAAAVWATLAGFDAISGWAPNVDHSSAASEQREGVGAVRRVQVGRIALLETVTAWQPETTLAYTVSGLPPAAGVVTTTWQLEAHNAATTVTVTTVIEPVSGPPGRIVGKVLGRRMAGAASQMLQGLSRQAAKEIA
jgi:uncharacterized protein YndB with AHSA1/START domain